MLASDANNPQFVGAHNPDAALVVRFHREAVLQPFRTKQENRPIYEDVDFIKIFTPGNQLNIIDTPVRDEHKQRFPQQWAAYQASHATGGEIGTPVSEWTFLTKSMAEEFKALKFFTIEQLANASDLQLQSLGMMGGMNPHVIRERAKAYLSAAAGTALPQAQAAELAETKAQLAALQKQMSDFMAVQSGMTPAPSAHEAKPKRKRRTKEEMTADAAASATEVSQQPLPHRPVETQPNQDAL